MLDTSSRDKELQSRINELKEPSSYVTEFKAPEMAALTQAIDILIELKRNANWTGHEVAWQKLQDALRYLEQIQKEHLDEERGV